MVAVVALERRRDGADYSGKKNGAEERCRGKTVIATVREVWSS
jgi:hypothetical protein